MRKGKRQQRDFFKKLESGGPEDEELGAKPEPKLLVGKLKSEVRAIFSQKKFETVKEA